MLRQDPKLLERLPRPVLPAAPAAPPPLGADRLVGRRVELAHLQGLAEQVSAGRAAVVVLEGEAGIGRDWASDVAVLLQAESALWLGDEPEWASAVEALLPYRGRQAVLGTPALSLGAYDELLGRIAERRGDLAGARRWWRSAREQGVLVGSPHQVALADSHLARVDGILAPREEAAVLGSAVPLP